MTPALLFALEQQQVEDLGLASLPVDKLAWMYANANRDPGEKDGDRVIRPPAPVLELSVFRTFSRKLATLAAKEDTWDYSLLGAKADHGAFAAWAGSKLAVEYTPFKEN